jgi:metal-sulfur cluster biosynthetic enzyme
MVSESAVRDALGTVRDPELDAPITDLGFVADLTIDGSRVDVRLQLPTYFCAANFAWLMVADAREAVRGVPGVEDAYVSLDDHFAGSQITDGANAGAEFDEAFEGLADGGLDMLRTLFRRKAFIARTYEVTRRLRQEGHTPQDLLAFRLRDLPAGEDVDAYIQRRAELGLDTGPDAPLLVDGAGRPVHDTEVELHLRQARSVAVSIEGNSGFCRAVLDARYGTTSAQREKEQV